MILVVFISTAVAFSFASENSWAATLITLRISQPQTQIATMNRAEAFTKNIEGKTQEAMGNITGNVKDQVVGKSKQLESQAGNAVENVKDSMNLPGRIQAGTKNLEGQIQEAFGNVTGNPKDKLMGKSKQLESRVRNDVENMKSRHW
jgi:uncharacterized protein YjbJ (UPF0337 family)